jgi:hypothetical protein
LLRRGDRNSSQSREGQEALHHDCDVSSSLRSPPAEESISGGRWDEGLMMEGMNGQVQGCLKIFIFWPMSMKL